MQNFGENGNVIVHLVIGGSRLTGAYFHPFHPQNVMLAFKRSKDRPKHVLKIETCNRNSAIF